MVYATKDFDLDQNMNNNEKYSKATRVGKGVQTHKPAFEVDTDIRVKITFDLAMRVADCILESPREDKQLVALAMQMRNESQ